MASKPKSVQIRLRENVPVENMIIRYLALMGERTGLEKQIFIKSMVEYIKENPLDGLDLPPSEEQPKVTKPEKVIETKVQEESKPASDDGYAVFETEPTKPIDPKKPKPEKVNKIAPSIMVGLARG